MSDPMISAENLRAESSPDRRTEPAAHVALLVVQVFFSTLPIAAKYHVLPHMPPAGLVILRVFGGAVVLLALARLRGRLTILDRHDFAKIAVYAMLGVTINQLLFIEGLSRTTAINAQVIATTVPAFTLGIGVLLGTDRLSPLRISGILMAACGAIYLIGPDRIQFTPDTTIGNAMIAFNAVAYSFYLVLAKPMLAKYDSVSVMAWVFLFGAIGVLPFGAVSLARSGALTTMPVSAWCGIAFIIVVPTVGSYLLNAWALKRSAPSIVATYMYLQPLLTGLLAVLMQGESIDPRAIPAAALIFVGVALTTRRQPEVS
jgi:drug/metabolite transporter (DMT)-like permease